MAKAYRGPAYTMAERIQSLDRNVQGLTSSPAFSGTWYNGHFLHTSTFTVPEEGSPGSPIQDSDVNIGVTVTLGASGLVQVFFYAELTVAVGTNAEIISTYTLEDTNTAYLTKPFPKALADLTGLSGATGSILFPVFGYGILQNIEDPGTTVTIGLNTFAADGDANTVQTVDIWCQTL